MKNALSLLLLLISMTFAVPQDDSLGHPVDYQFLLQDAPAQIFTMQQVNQSYVSAVRLFSRATYSLIDNARIAELLQLGGLCFYFMTFTHEEGHRSILTKENIGSISVPYFNKSGAAYVKGVTDRTLQNLRDRNLPEYIRLHTAGLESDFMLTKRIETIGAFGMDTYQFYKLEYLIRKLAILQYYIPGLLKYEIGLKEEKNELERDIVGFDTYGAVRHLFRPTMEFYRYTGYADLTKEEKTFIKRTGYRSLLNLLHPLVIGKERFKLTDHISGTAGAGYTMAPFGDFIDEQVWATFNDEIHVYFYARQFQNRRNWFGGCGGGVLGYSPINCLSIDVQGHFWQQPDKMQFNTDASIVGGAADCALSYFFLYGKQANVKKGVSVDLGFIYKTDGFLPEAMFLDEHIGFRIGTTLRL
jgi:hypothetical protein